MISTLAKNVVLRVFGVVRYQNVKMPANATVCMTYRNDVLRNVPFWRFKHHNAIMTILSHI